MVDLYRGTTFIKKLVPVTAKIRRAINSIFTLEIELADISDIYTGDLLKLTYNDENYTFVVREIEERKITAEHISYKLANYALIDKYLNNPPTYDDKIEFANIRLTDIVAFLSPLFNDAGFSITNNATTTELKDISFANDNLLSALQKVVDAYNVEFVPHDEYIQIVDQAGADRGITINAGINTEKITKNIDRSNIVTRIYPIGSSENLPDGYYYTELRPTTFNLSTKTHSGNLYVENSEGIQQYGLIEKIVEFKEVKVQSRRGTVQAVGTMALPEYGNKVYPYIYDSSLGDIDEQKAVSAILFIQNNLKRAELRIVKVSATSKLIFYSPVLKDGSTLSWTPAIGSEYILVGYITQTEMDAARDKLIAEAQKYLADNSAPKITYNLSDVFIKDLVIDIGDRVKLKDEKQGINDTVRIVEYEKDLITDIYRSLKLSNTVDKIPYLILRQQQELKKEVQTIKIDLADIAATARETLERHNLLVRNNFYGSENEYILIGSEARNYIAKGLTITPDSVIAGRVTWTPFTFQDMFDETAYQCATGEVSLTAGTYYIFIRIQKGDYLNVAGMNTLVFTQSKPTSSGSIVYYALGMAEFDGTRTKVATSYGFTYISGDFIKTGTIEGSTGTTKIDLKNDIITVANDTIKIGKDALGTGQHGIKVTGNVAIESGITDRKHTITPYGATLVFKDANGNTRESILQAVLTSGTAFIGAGSDSTIVTHNLGTRDIRVLLVPRRYIKPQYDNVELYSEVIDANRIKIWAFETTTYQVLSDSTQGFNVRETGYYLWSVPSNTVRGSVTVSHFGLFAIFHSEYFYDYNATGAYTLRVNAYSDNSLGIRWKNGSSDDIVVTGLYGGRTVRVILYGYTKYNLSKPVLIDYYILPSETFIPPSTGGTRSPE